MSTTDYYHSSSEILFKIDAFGQNTLHISNGGSDSINVHTLAYVYVYIVIGLRYVYNIILWHRKNTVGFFFYILRPLLLFFNVPKQYRSVYAGEVGF